VPEYCVFNRGRRRWEKRGREGGEKGSVELGRVLLPQQKALTGGVERKVKNSGGGRGGEKLTRSFLSSQCKCCQKIGKMGGFRGKKGGEGGCHAPIGPECFHLLPMGVCSWRKGRKKRKKGKRKEWDKCACRRREFIYLHAVR